MIGALTGYALCFDDHILLDVAGVGYLIFCSNKTLGNISNNSYQKLFIETYVREDKIHLYGFLSLEEKNTFNLLQSVNGIGPRMALSILSALSPEQIASAVSLADKVAFNAISGVGPKLAERILIELKNKLPITNANQYSIVSNIANDAISALMNLGRNKLDAQNTIMQILKDSPDIEIDELIRKALKG